VFAIFAVLNAPALATENPLVIYEAAHAAYEQGDYANALIYGKIAGAGGDADAQALVGHILMRGKAGAADNSDAVKWLLKAANQGHSDAMIALGELALASSGGLSPADAVKWLTKAADQGRPEAMQALADIYLKGIGTAPDPAKGKNWLIKASNYGDADAMRRLGDMAFDTRPNDALAWYERAAQSGDSQAAYIAAIMYAENFEIKPDAAKAAALLKQAAEAGIAAAMADYGLMIYQGNGAPKSATEAAKWFRKSAQAGDPEGRFLYAFTLAKGDGVPQNYEDAYYWLLRAQADSGKTGADDYDRSRTELRQRLEKNVAPAILERARKRAASKP
jgi:TPR repeat protein